jgi:inner membrane protein involved in colicin E2 resistance
MLFSSVLQLPLLSSSQLLIEKEILMTRYVISILFIFFCTTIAWAVLGTTIFSRTYSFDSILKSRVASIWGAPHVQKPPTAQTTKTSLRKEEAKEGDKTVLRTVQDHVQRSLSLEGSNLAVALDLEHRQKGLLWYSTYKVAFDGSFSFENTTDEELVTFTLHFPTAQAIYDDLVFTVDGEPIRLENQKSAVRGTARVAPGKTAVLTVKYRSRGLESWRYHFGDDVSQVKNFQLKMTTNFRDIDFPENTLAALEKKPVRSGWELTWNYKNLLSGYQIGMVLPEKLQPGPLAGQISYFAPISLFFFFFLMFIITTLRNIDLHPMNYFFLACSFFAFHLLLAYLVDHISIHWAFAICSLVSIGLVVSYLRLVVGIRFAAVEAGIAQMVYLVLFSYAFFFKGLTGLAITIGSILTLFVVMQMTGRIRWSEKFASRAPVPLANK